MARASLNYISLHEEYDDTAPNDVSGSSKGKIPEHSNSDNQWGKLEGVKGVDETRKSKRRRVTSSKVLEALETGSAVSVGLASARESRKEIDKKDAGDVRSKQWRRASIDGVGEQKRFIGLGCKVYWPLDDDWYYGQLFGYNPVTERHQVKYEDGYGEHLCLSKEEISFYVSSEEMLKLNLSCAQHPDVKHTHFQYSSHSYKRSTPSKYPWNRERRWNEEKLEE